MPTEEAVRAAAPGRLYRGAGAKFPLAESAKQKTDGKRLNVSDFEEHHRCFATSCKRMVERHVAPIAAGDRRELPLSRRAGSIFGDMGLLQHWVPEEYGGPGGDLTCLSRQGRDRQGLDRLARSWPAKFVRPGPSDPEFRHRGAEAPILPLRRQGQDADRGRHHRAGIRLRRLVHEDQARCSDGVAWVINGQRSSSPSARSRTGCWCLPAPATATAPTASAPSWSIPRRRVSIGKEERKMGHPRRTERADRSSTTCAFPSKTCRRQRGKASRPACISSTSTGRPSAAARSASARARSISHRLRQGTQGSSAERSASNPGHPIHARGHGRSRLEAARALLFDCTRQVDMGDFSQLSMMASMAKCFASDVAMKVTTDAVQIFGGAGYHAGLSQSSAIMRDAKINQIFEGTNQIQRLVIARHMLREGSHDRPSSRSPPRTRSPIVEDGMTIGIGGWIFHGQPMALVRGLIRKDVRNLRSGPRPRQHRAGHADRRRLRRRRRLRVHQLRASRAWRRISAARRRPGAIKVLEMDGPASPAACAPAPATCPMA